MMNKVFIDTDIILDLLAKRDPFYYHSASLFSLIESGKLRGFVSSLIFSNLYYILKKHNTRKDTIEILKKLKVMITVLPVDDKIIDRALLSDFNDFEDAIQYYTAKTNNIDYIITRNIKDYKSSDIKALSADQLLNILNNTKNGAGHFK